MRVMRYLILGLCLQGLVCYAGEAKKADFVIFSYDRPLQLFALLESAHLYMDGLGQTTVIYRVSNEAFEKAYQEVAHTFGDVVFLKQGANPAQDFKPLTLHAVFDSPHEYILFAVDDSIVKDCIDIVRDIGHLERYGAYALYYRFGLHLSYCHPESRAQRVPDHRWLENDLYEFHLGGGECDWGWLHSVDMTLHRKKDIERDLKEMNYWSPNIFEHEWNCRSNLITNKKGLFYGLSKMVNIPINRVQQYWLTRNMNLLSPQELLDLFNKRLKIDILPLYGIKNKSVHIDFVPTFVGR